jgi:hypothetical protein
MKLACDVQKSSLRCLLLLIAPLVQDHGREAHRGNRKQVGFQATHSMRCTLEFGRLTQHSSCQPQIRREPPASFHAPLGYNSLRDGDSAKQARGGKDQSMLPCTQVRLSQQGRTCAW